MIEKSELNAIKRNAEKKRQAYLNNHPGVQVPPDEGPQVLMLVTEIERLYDLARSAVAAGIVVAA